jgi:fluoroacetyl-CoA thioesterase
VKETLQPGIRYEHRFVVTQGQTVPRLYPEAAEFAAMPAVLATGFLVGFLEWACVLAVKPHLDWPREQSLGTHIDISHEAATPPGLELIGTVELVEVDGRRLVFAVEASDGVDVVSRGLLERVVVSRDGFDTRLEAKGAHADLEPGHPA